MERWLSFQTKGMGYRRMGEQPHVPGRENSIISTDALGISSISREKESNRSSLDRYSDVFCAGTRNAEVGSSRLLVPFVDTTAKFA
jgi:hypothetical protein